MSGNGGVAVRVHSGGLHRLHRPLTAFMALVAGMVVAMHAAPVGADQSTEHPGDEPRVALTAVSVGNTLAEARGRIVEEAERGLRSAGVPLQPISRTLAPAGSADERCRDVGCMRDVARSLDVDYLVLTDVENSTASFTIRVRFVRARDGAHLSDESLTCAATDPCRPVPESAAEVAREAGRKAMREIALTRDAPPNMVGEHGEAAPVVTPAAVDLDSRAASATGTNGAGGDFLHTPWPWIGAGVVAAAAIGVGIYYLSIDGQEIDCGAGGCANVRDSSTPGVAWTVAGGALGAAAVIGYMVSGRF